MTSSLALGHVSMTVERYNSLSFDERQRVWSELISQLDLDPNVVWLPIPYTDRATMMVGMNIVKVGSLTGRSA
jgi:hypothetical protein